MLNVNEAYDQAHVANMRLRLTIQRHLLPSLDILWNVDTSNARAILTIAQLIEQVNEVVPLEHNQWGLEDYVAEVKGYECIHHFRVRDVLRDEDEVTIRPLEKHERRLRARSGRTQISESGLHLIDGTPFGKQQQPPRKINRPLVQIPQSQPQPELLLENASDVGKEAGEDETADSNDVVVSSSRTSGHARLLLEDKENKNFRSSKRKLAEFRKDEGPNVDSNGSLRKRKSVKFDKSSTCGRGNQSATAKVSKADTELLDDDDDDDFQPSPDSSDTDEVDQDDGAASGDNVSSRGSESNPGETEDSPDSSSSYISSSSSSSISSSSSATSEEDNAGELKDKQSFQKAFSECIPMPRKADRLATSLKGRHSIRSTPRKDSVLPGGGLRKTVARNKRRRDAKRLRYLKSRGALPPEATLLDLQDFFEKLSKLEEQATLSKKTTNGDQKNAQPASHNGQAKTQAQDQGQKNPDISASNAISTNLASGSSSTIKNNDVISTTKPPKPNALSPLSDQNAEPTLRTSKLDVDSSRRIVFNSLGYRNPKNVADEERIRAKIETSAKRNPVPTSMVSQPAVNKDSEQRMSKDCLEDPEYWKRKINLSAVECCDEGLELPEPPFPFKQRWYSQQFQRSASEAMSVGKKRKRKGRHAVDQTINGVNGAYAGSDKIMLNYDDGHNEEEAATKSNANNGNNNDATTNGGIYSVTDFPSLPDDPISLPIATSKDLIPGAILAFKSLELSSATNWEPRISAFKVGKLKYTTPSPISEGRSNGEKQPDPNTLILELAQRDSFPEKSVRFDGKGRRLYAKFEMEGYDEEYDDEDKENDYDFAASINGAGDEGDEDEYGEDDEGLAATSNQPRRRSNRGKMLVITRDELVDLRLLRAASASESAASTSASASATATTTSENPNT